MRLLRFLSSARPEANWLAGTSLAVLFLKVLALNRIPELFRGGYELGVIVEAILASVVASYVFYLLVVHLKDRSDRTAVHPYIAKHVTRVIGDCQSQLQEIGRAAGVEVSLTNAAESIADAFTKIAPYSRAPLLMSPPDVYANWFQYFFFYRDRTRESIRRVLAQLPFIDAALVGLLASIDDCTHFFSLEYLQQARVRNEDLSAWTSTFVEYCGHCRKLNDYREAHFS